MSVSGVSNQNTANAYSNYGSTAAKANPAAAEKTAEEAGAVYEPSKNSGTAAASKYKPNTELISKLKADAEQRTAQLQNLVTKLMQGQGNAQAKADDIWSFLADGKFVVDAATKAQAQKDIAEDGYWGVNQTSDRIIDFAKALTGGDPDQIEKMKGAFEKGFKAATKTWGKSLPDISSKTYDAVMDKFKKWEEDSKTIV